MSVKALYVLNGFNPGGAEIGLLTLLENGFMRSLDFRVFVLMRGNQELRDRVAAIVGEARLIEVSKDTKLTLGVLIKGFFQLAGIIQGWRPHVVILSLKQSNIVGRAALLGVRGPRCIAFEHIAKLEKGRFTQVYEYILRHLSHRVDEIWADCRATLDGTRAYYPLDKAFVTRVVPLFVRDDNPPVKLSYELGQPVRLVVAGRLIARKRHDLILLAMKRLRDEGIQSTLTIFGDGPTRSDIEAWALNLGLSHAISFSGFRPNWWRDAEMFDIFVHPSDEEGFCIVAAEAMMIGLPVVATKVGGLCDYASDGKNAILVPTGDAEAICRALIDLTTDAAKRLAIGRGGAENIFNRFSRRVLTAELDQLSDSICI